MLGVQEDITIGVDVDNRFFLMRGKRVIESCRVDFYGVGEVIYDAVFNRLNTNNYCFAEIGSFCIIVVNVHVIILVNKDRTDDDTGNKV